MTEENKQKHIEDSRRHNQKEKRRKTRGTGTKSYLEDEQ